MRPRRYGKTRRLAGAVLAATVGGALVATVPATPATAATTGAEVTVIKDAVPDDGQDFVIGLRPVGGGATGVTLDDDDDAANPDSHTFTSVPAGDYEIVESEVAGWRLTDVTCTGATATFDGESGVTAFSVTDGDVVACTLTNRRLGAVEVVLETAPATTSPFAFSGALGGFDLDTAASTARPDRTGAVPVLPGIHAVSVDPPAGWRAESVECSDGGPTTSTSASIDVAPGEKVTCRFRAFRPATLTVMHVTTPDSGSRFAYALGRPAARTVTKILDTRPGGPLPSSTSLDGLSPGAHTVTPTAPRGWRLERGGCVGASTKTADGTVSVAVGGGDTVTCRFVWKPRLVEMTIRNRLGDLPRRVRARDLRFVYDLDCEGESHDRTVAGGNPIVTRARDNRVTRIPLGLDCRIRLAEVRGLGSAALAKFSSEFVGVEVLAGGLIAVDEGLTLEVDHEVVGRLPDTGTSTTALATVGAALVVAGGAFVAVGRRRRTA